MTSPSLPRRLEYTPVDDLPDHPDNPRDHDEATLRQSVERFGFTDPPMIDERTGLLAEGHGRKHVTQAMRDAGESPPDGVVVEDGVWYVPVVRGWSSSSDVEARAYLLAGNIGGGWKADPLAALLVQLDESDRGLDGTPFAGDDLADLLASLAPAGDNGDRPAPERQRETQGIHEVAIMLQAEGYREFVALVAQLRKKWELDATPLVVLRALRDAAEA